MKAKVEGESTGPWTPIVRRSSLDDLRRSRQSFQDSIEGLNVAKSPLQTPNPPTQIICSKEFGDIRSDLNQARVLLTKSLEDANLKQVAPVGVQPIGKELFPNDACSMYVSDSVRLPVWNRPVLTGTAPFYMPINGRDCMEYCTPPDGSFASMYDTFVTPVSYSPEQGRGLATSCWFTSNDGFQFPSQEDASSLKTQGTFLTSPFDEMEALTGHNLHNTCLTASKSCPSSLQPASTRLTPPPGAKQTLRRVRSEKTNIMTPIKKRMNKSKQSTPRTAIKREQIQNWKTNRKQRTSKRRTLVRSSSQDSEIVNNGQSPPGASASRVETRGRSTFADMVRDKVIKMGPQIWSVGHDANVHVFVKPNGSIVYKGSEFHSISSFALAVIRERNPCRLACDGWKDVKCEGRRLDNLREMYLYCTPS